MQLRRRGCGVLGDRRRYLRRVVDAVENFDGEGDVGRGGEDRLDLPPGLLGDLGHRVVIGGVLHGNYEVAAFHPDRNRSQSLAHGHREHAPEDGGDGVGVGIPHFQPQLIGDRGHQIALGHHAFGGEDLGQGQARLGLPEQRRFERVLGQNLAGDEKLPY